MNRTPVPLLLLAVSMTLAGFAAKAPAHLAKASGAAATVPGPLSFTLTASLPADAFPSGIAAGDFNNDGIPDLAVVASSNCVIAVYLGKGDGTFGSSLGTTASAAPGLVAVGKFDGINLDAVIDSEEGGNALLLLGAGTGFFQGSTFIDMRGGFAGGIAVGDFNGDQKDDLAITDQEGHVLIYLGNGDGTFQAAKVFPVGSPGDQFPEPVVAGDFNGDGKLDLAFLSPAESTFDATVNVLLGNGDGTFGAPSHFRARRNGEYFPRALAVGDFNADQRLDVALVFSNGLPVDHGYAQILLGNGDGTFHPGARTLTVPNPNDVAAADFNGDGKLDLAVASDLNGTKGPGQLSVLAGNGDGTFQAPVSFPINGNIPVQLVVADFNLDGKPDVAMVNGGSANVSVLLNTTTFSSDKSSTPAHQ
jgi:FG-GAP-like repeat/FG-GAP repeat